MSITIDEVEFLRESLDIHNNELLEKMSRASEIRYFTKGDVLIHAGDSQEYADLLIEGLLRSYFTDYRGRDITALFMYEKGSVALGCHGFEKAAIVSISALAPSYVLRIPVKVMSQLLLEYHELALVYTTILQNELDHQWQIKKAMYQYSALDRYLWFMREYNRLNDIVPDKYIASFLNVSPVTLSRIKAELRRFPEEKREAPGRRTEA